jgi:hypothetical protein
VAAADQPAPAASIPPLGLPPTAPADFIAPLSCPPRAPAGGAGSRRRYRGGPSRLPRNWPAADARLDPPGRLGYRAVVEGYETFPVRVAGAPAPSPADARPALGDRFAALGALRAGGRGRVGG